MANAQKCKVQVQDGQVKHHKNKFPWDNCPLFTFNCSTSPSRRDVEYDFARHAFKFRTHVHPVGRDT